MYIIFDGRHIKNKYSGLGRFTFSLLLELIKFDQFNKLDIIIENDVVLENNEIYNYILNLKKININFIKINAPLFNLLKAQKIVSYVNNANADLYFHPHFDLPLGIKIKCLFVVHDVFSQKTFFHEDENNSIFDLIYGFKKKRFLKNIIFNSIIKYNIKKENINCIAVSNATKNDLLNFVDSIYKHKIRVVYEAPFNNSILEEEKSEIYFDNNILNEKYLLYVGDRRPHKNLKRMIDIFQELNKIYKDLKFYIVGNNKIINFNYDKYLLKLNNNNIKVFSNISDILLDKFYSHCEIFFFLSKYEGFGLPLLEVSKYNKKIITSNKSSMSEIAPDSSLFLDPNINIINAISLIENYLRMNKDINNEHFLNQFSWTKAMKEIFYE
jgi:glycosyltransferase involved in cell wall biosynthesis